MSHSEVARGYAEDVAAGRILACRWIRLACERHLRDLERSEGEDFPFCFDDDRANRACKFIELQRHTKGRWAAAGERITLEPWQVFFVASIFGWVRKIDGMRRFRRALLLVPRKNGKSLIAAAIGLYMLSADGEHGAEVYSGATTEKQAWEVFRPARLMAQRNEPMRDHYGIEVNASNIHILANGSRFEPVIGKPGDGASPSCAITDEYHEHATDDLLETMETGMGARDQPLSLIITTAGDNMAGPCFGLQVDAQKILDDVAENEEFFALIYTVDAEDDWTSEEALRKANPNFDVSVAREFLLSRQTEAINNARKQGTFQTKHLNIWVGAREAYFNVQKWRDAAQEVAMEDFAGDPCRLALDLASKVDIAALEVLFDLAECVSPAADALRAAGFKYARFGRYYLPEATVSAGENEHYQGWMREGRLTVTDGEIIDFEQIRDDIIDLSGWLTVREVAYDPHQATMLVTALMKEGVPVIEFRPTVLNFSEPMKQLDALIRAGQIAHDGCPVMTWQISNVVAREDAKDNVYPRKERAENKIDSVVALISALGRAMAEQPEDAGRSVYEERGLLTL